jgi:hypothetical protein
VLREQMTVGSCGRYLGVQLGHGAQLQVSRNGSCLKQLTKNLATLDPLLTVLLFVYEHILLPISSF